MPPCTFRLAQVHEALADSGPSDRCQWVPTCTAEHHLLLGQRPLLPRPGRRRPKGRAPSCMPGLQLLHALLPQNGRVHAWASRHACTAHTKQAERQRLEVMWRIGLGVI